MAKEKSNDDAKPSTSGSRSQKSKNIFEDARFQHLVTDPRFKNLPREQRKVKIDKRFQGMFTDKKFQVTYTVDKYGRKVKSSSAEELKKYYELNSSDSESDKDDQIDDGSDKEEVEEQRKEEEAITREAKGLDDAAAVSSASDEEASGNDALNSDGEVVPQNLRKRLLNPNIDYARGEGRLLTDSSSDDESSDDGDDPELYIEHVWGELDGEAETTDESTNRLAVCNMDWDRIRSSDLMVLFSSFLPPGGSILSVKIYPSQFGKERLAEEEMHGPPELVGLGNMDDKRMAKSISKDDAESSSEEELVQEQDSEAEEGDDYHMEKLRQYQLNRLRYYYAIVECDSVATADKIYKECDGIEYESSATRVDLRFVPDDTTFDDEPRDVCTEMPDVNTYKPRQFTTTALQQAKVDLTWDETALERRELGDKLLSGKLNEVSDKDLKTIVAFSSEDEDERSEVGSNDEGEANKNKEGAIGEISQANKSIKLEKKSDIIAKYKSLLAEINEKEQKEKNKKYEMEFTWDVQDSKENESSNDAKLEEKAKSELTPIEKVLLKRSEKNKKRKEERRKKKLEALGINPDDANSDGYSDSRPDDIDMDDPYFAEEFANGDFIDPKVKKREKEKRAKELLKQRQREEEEEAERQAKELKLLLDEDDLENESKKHFSLDKILKAEQEPNSKRKRRKLLKKPKSAIANESKEIEDNFQLNLNDERFKSVFTSHKFSIDPTDSRYKKTKGMEMIIQEKLKRRHGNEDTANSNEETNIKIPKKQLENTLLVKNLKRKIQMNQQK